MNASHERRRIAVIGGGVSGLAAAHRVLELDKTCEVVLFEAADRVGGVLRTERRDGFLIEYGADGFITNLPWATNLCQRIDMDHDLLETNPTYRKTFVVSKGQLRRIPDGFAMMTPTRVWPIVATPVLSLRGKLRLACEPFIPASTTDEESLASFVRRRLGREAYERLVQPLVGSIHTGDPDKLSMSAILPRFVDMERKHGSLLRAMRQQQKGPRGGREEKAHQQAASGARFSLFVAPREGMSSLAAALAARFPEGSIRVNSSVDQIEQRDGRWLLSIGEQESVEADGLILATPAPHAAQLLASLDQELGQLLRGIPHSRCAILSLGYRREQIAHPLDGFGFVVPSVEKRNVLCGSFSSVKYAERAPDGSVLLRAFVGGSEHAELLDRSDAELQALVQDDLRQLIGCEGDPVCCVVARPPAMPQYYLGHAQLVERIRSRAAALSPGLEVVGSAFDGVGVPQCIHSGEQAAERLLKRPARASHCV